MEFVDNFKVEMRLDSLEMKDHFSEDDRKSFVKRRTMGDMAEKRFGGSMSWHARRGH